MAKKRKKILVTGGAGFIGSHLVDELLNKQHEVIVIDNLCNGDLNNLSKSIKNENFSFHNIDILNSFELDKIQTKIDVVFHLACLGVRHSLHSPIENHKVNAEGTLRILNFALNCNVKKFIYISTSEVYGKTQNFPINENSVTNPTTVYGGSKLAGEFYTKAFNQANGLEYLIIRLFNNYGPRAHYKGDSGELIPRAIVRMISGKNPIIFGDGTFTRDFLFVKDAVKILCQLLIKPKLKNTIINVGAGRETSIKAIISELLILFPKNKLSINYLQERPGDVPRLWVDNRKMINLIGNQTFLNLKDGLSKTVDFYKRMKIGDYFKSNLIEINWMK